jgi:hypothetical protein
MLSAGTSRDQISSGALASHAGSRRLGPCLADGIIPIPMTTGTSIELWAACAVLAVGVAWSRYEKKRTRDKFLRELAAMEPDRREKLLTRLRPELQAELREQLMERFRLVNFR